MVSWKDSEARLELMNEWESIKGHLDYAKEYATDVFWGAMPEKIQREREKTHPDYNAVRATKISGATEVVAALIGLPYTSLAVAFVGTVALFGGIYRYEEADKGKVNGSAFTAVPYKAYDGSLLVRER